MNNFCYHPWAGLNVETDGEVMPCCKFNNLDPLWRKQNISDGIDTYLASPELKTLQEQFIAGQKPSACYRCWRDEEAGFLSKRQMDNDRWQEDKDKGLLFITVPIGNLCNLKCRICGPENSSSWYKEYHSIYGVNHKQQSWHKNKKIWNDLISRSKESVEIQIHGGEPFLYQNAEHVEMITELARSGASKHIRLHYSTNGTIWPVEELWKAWADFMWVDIQVSVDDMEQRFEYNRHPAKWNVVKENLLRYRNQVKASSNLQLSISTTVSAFTIAYLDEFCTEIAKIRLPKPWLGRLQNPIMYRAGVLPNAAKDWIRTRLLSSIHKDVRKTASWLDEDVTEHIGALKRAIEVHDRYRKEDFKKTFPELSAFLD